MKEECGKIILNECIAKDTFKIVVEASMASEMKPGQFVNLQIPGYFLRRPISICSVEDENHFVMIYKVVGDGTKALSQCKVQDEIQVFGPLGSCYPIEDEQEVLIIGGGVGVPPMYELAKQYVNKGSKVYVVLGFNDAASVFYKEEFEALGAMVYVATMDGSMGVKGTVMDAIAQANITCDYVCSCGPLPMLRAIEANYTRGYMSFESRMACGIGACMACVAKDKKEENLYHKICKEGPVFPIGKVEF